MKKRIRVLALIGIAAVLIASLAVGAREEAGKEKAASKDKDDLYASLEIFADAVSLIRSDYVDEVESKKLIYGALKGMLISLDDFSQFLEPDEYKEIQLETKGEFGGVGIEISTRDGVLTVIAAIAGTPADTAGVKAGDRIVKINGVVTREMSVS